MRYVIGGTHLVDTEEINEIADWFEGKLDLVAGTHCTGFEAQAILADRLPEAFRPSASGVKSSCHQSRANNRRNSSLDFQPDEYARCIQHRLH